MKSKNLLKFLIDRSGSPFWLKMLELTLNRFIPFNRAHHFKFRSLSDKSALQSLPFIRSNKNHLASSHACAIATLGEYPAGLLLLKNFSSSEYRIILKELKADYLKQSKGELFGFVELSEQEQKRIKHDLGQSESIDVTLTTNIRTNESLDIAIIKTTWQLKRWSKVKFS